MMINVDMSTKILKNVICAKKIWNPATRSWENCKYLGNIIEDSVITMMKL